MNDGVIKGTGNSRYLKSSISADTTLTEIIAMLRDGTFPIDLNGINPEGWTALATALIKANLLSDSTAAKIAAAFGVAVPTTVNEALNDMATPPIYQKLLSVTVGTAAQSISLDLSGITMADYVELIIAANVYTVNGTTISMTANTHTYGYCGSRLGIDSNVTAISNAASFGSIPTAASATYLYGTPILVKIQQGAYNSVATFAMLNIEFSGGLGTQGHMLGHCGKSISTNLTSFQFTSASGNIMAGSTFEVYGVEK